MVGPWRRLQPSGGRRQQLRPRGATTRHRRRGRRAAKAEWTKRRRRRRSNGSRIAQVGGGARRTGRILEARDRSTPTSRSSAAWAARDADARSSRRSRSDGALRIPLHRRAQLVGELCAARVRVHALRVLVRAARSRCPRRHDGVLRRLRPQPLASSCTPSLGFEHGIQLAGHSQAESTRTARARGVCGTARSRACLFLWHAHPCSLQHRVFVHSSSCSAVQSVQLGTSRSASIIEAVLGRLQHERVAPLPPRRRERLLVGEREAPQPLQARSLGLVAARPAPRGWPPPPPAPRAPAASRAAPRARASRPPPSTRSAAAHVSLDGARRRARAPARRRARPARSVAAIRPPGRPPTSAGSRCSRQAPAAPLLKACDPPRAPRVRARQRGLLLLDGQPSARRASPPSPRALAQPAQLLGRHRQLLLRRRARRCCGRPRRGRPGSLFGSRAPGRGPAARRGRRPRRRGRSIMRVGEQQQGGVLLLQPPRLVDLAPPAVALARRRVGRSPSAPPPTLGAVLAPRAARARTPRTTTPRRARRRPPPREVTLLIVVGGNAALVFRVARRPRRGGRLRRRRGGGPPATRAAPSPPMPRAPPDWRSRWVRDARRRLGRRRLEPGHVLAARARPTAHTRTSAERGRSPPRVLSPLVRRAAQQRARVGAAASTATRASASAASRSAMLIDATGRDLRRRPPPPRRSSFGPAPTRAPPSATSSVAAATRPRRHADAAGRLLLPYPRPRRPRLPSAAQGPRSTWSACPLRRAVTGRCSG